MNTYKVYIGYRFRLDNVLVEAVNEFEAAVSIFTRFPGARIVRMIEL